jgi:Glyoxalase-like domain
MSGLRVDHIIYAVADLDEGAARFRDVFGLGSIPGGHHPAWGTENRIVPLGHEYVELVTVADHDQAAACAFGTAVIASLADARPLLGWAVATNDLQSVADRLRLEVTPGERTRPDGTVLRWRLAGVAPALRTGALPFFIEWELPPALQPGAADAGHAVQPHGIAAIELAVNRGTLARWLADHRLPVRMTAGPGRLSAVTIATAAGDRVLR